jgi:hypothetical protein
VANTVADRFSPRGPSTETLPPATLPLKPLLESMTVSQLRSYAREQGRGGNGLSSAKKAEIIDRLLSRLMPTWGPDDIRLIGDGLAVAVGALLLRGLSMLIIEAYIKPALIWIGRSGYRRLDELSGDRLPDWFAAKESQDHPDV